jgi:hypothetical protein
MHVERAFELINNLDEADARRRFMPQWSTVVVDQLGEVIDVIRHREAPNPELDRRHMDMYPRSVQFTACPGLFPTLEALREKVKDCVWAHKHF